MVPGVHYPDITLSHKLSLVLVNSTIRPMLLLEHPLTIHRFVTIRLINDLPSSIRKNEVHRTMDNFFLIIYIKTSKYL
jgi:hypothetical protein